MGAKRLTAAQRKILLKHGKAYGVNDKNISDYYYYGLERINLSGGSLSKGSYKQEKWTFVNMRTNEKIDVLGDIVK